MGLALVPSFRRECCKNGDFRHQLQKAQNRTKRPNADSRNQKFPAADDADYANGAKFRALLMRAIRVIGVIRG